MGDGGKSSTSGGGGLRVAASSAHPRSLYIAIDGVPRILFDVEELTAAVARAPPRKRLAAEPSALIPRWISAELELYLRRR